ncbi:MAG: cell division protein FtsQ/DivIB [Alphaproteobacteria bacterium]|nr:cell division protein FtsQ/DivIB [Alphaproteobacteria bacterium]
MRPTKRKRIPAVPDPFWSLKRVKKLFVFSGKAKTKGRGSQRKIRQKRFFKHYKGLFIAGFATILFVAGYVSWWLGYPQQATIVITDKIVASTAIMGLKVSDVYVEGRQHSSQTAILDCVRAKRGDPILAYNLDTIRADLEKIDWIKSACVRRHFPGFLYIQLEERKPIAIWQNQNQQFLVDQDGITINITNVAYFQSLPVIVGGDAPAHAPRILSLLEKFPLIRKELRSIIRMRQRRWDLVLENSVLVKLPEEKMEDALAHLSVLIEKQKINPGEVSVIDLRIPKQIILKLSPGAAVRLRIKGKET